MSIKLSIVIPVFNNANFTKACLEDLAHLPEDCEIIIVDNCSTDDTEHVILEFCNKRRSWRVIALSKNHGFAYACNKGFEAAKSEYVMFLNNDVRLKDNSQAASWVNTLLENVSEGIVGPTIGLLTKGLDFVEETSVWPANNQLLVYLSGWCITAKKETWDKLVLPNEVGPFSTEFGLAYFEDTDAMFRATELHIPLKIQPIPVHHFGKMTSRKLNTASLYLAAKQKFKEKWLGDRINNLPKQY